MRGIFTLRKVFRTRLVFCRLAPSFYTPGGVFNLCWLFCETGQALYIYLYQLWPSSVLQRHAMHTMLGKLLQQYFFRRESCWSRTKRFTASQRVHIVQKKSPDTDMVLQAFAFPFRLSQTIT